MLRDAHSLGTAADPAELHALLRTGQVDLLILDPSMRNGGDADELEAIIAGHPALPVVVYTVLAPAAMRHVVRLARLGVQHVVVNRFDDEPTRFLQLIERVPAHPLAELLLKELAEPLRAVPLVLARAIEQLIRSPSYVRNARELAAAATMTPRTLYRHLSPLGLVPRQLIACARLLRAYTMLAGPTRLLKEIALKLGYSDPEQLTNQLSEWTGLAPRDIRRALSPERFVQLLAEHLLHPTADITDGGESD